MLNKSLFHTFFILLLCFSVLNAQNDKNNQTVNVRIVSWNIQMLPNSLGVFSKALRKKQRVREPWISEHCNNNGYDVIIFQEVFDLDIKRKLKKRLKDNYPYQINTKTQCGRLTSNGIFIISRHPVKYVDHVIYDKGAHEDGWAAKGCTLVEVEKEGLRFQVAGTHLQSGDSDAAVHHRDLQFQNIRNLLDSNFVDKVPVFVAGDMNTRKSNVEKYEMMLKVIGVSDFPINEKEPFTIDGKNSWNKHSKGIQLDYILLNERNSSSKIIEQKVLREKHDWKGEETDLSDHYGVVSDVLIVN